MDPNCKIDFIWDRWAELPAVRQGPTRAGEHWRRDGQLWWVKYNCRHFARKTNQNLYRRIQVSTLSKLTTRKSPRSTTSKLTRPWLISATRSPSLTKVLLGSSRCVRCQFLLSRINQFAWVGCVDELQAICWMKSKFWNSWPVWRPWSCPIRSKKSTPKSWRRSSTIRATSPSYSVNNLNIFTYRTMTLDVE